MSVATLDPESRRLPVRGEVWRHNKTGGHYEIVGSAFDVVHKCVGVIYEPMYPCDHAQFFRPLLKTEKSFVKVDKDGKPRFTCVGNVGCKHKMDWYYPPEED